MGYKVKSSEIDVEMELMEKMHELGIEIIYNPLDETKEDNTDEKEDSE